jgi:hypothetical protein
MKNIKIAGKVEEKEGKKIVKITKYRRNKITLYGKNALSRS